MLIYILHNENATTLSINRFMNHFVFYELKYVQRFNKPQIIIALLQPRRNKDRTIALINAQYYFMINIKCQYAIIIAVKKLINKKHKKNKRSEYFYSIKIKILYFKEKVFQKFNEEYQ